MLKHPHRTLVSLTLHVRIVACDPSPALPAASQLLQSSLCWTLPLAQVWRIEGQGTVLGRESRGATLCLGVARSPGGHAGVLSRIASCSQAHIIRRPSSAWSPLELQLDKAQSLFQRRRERHEKR